MILMIGGARCFMVNLSVKGPPFEEAANGCEAWERSSNILFGRYQLDLSILAFIHGTDPTEDLFITNDTVTWNFPGLLGSSWNFPKTINIITNTFFGPRGPICLLPFIGTATEALFIHWSRFIWSHHAVLSSHQKDIKKNMNSNVLPLTLFLSTGPDLSLVLILVALPPNISSVFRQDPIRLHISNFVYLGFRRIFPEWFSIHIVDKYWLHFRPQSIAAEVGFFHKTFSVQYSFNVLYLKDQV